MASLLCNKSALVATPKGTKTARRAAVPSIVCKAQQTDVDRRAALGMMASSVSLLAGVAPSVAAYGESANVFGKVTNKTGFVPYSGENFALLIPSKWNPSPEREEPNIVVRYADNFDAVNNFYVIVTDTDKKSIKDFGSPEQFLSNFTYLLGFSSFTGETISEGGFKPNSLGTASLLDVGEETDKKGKVYYSAQLLTRAADGDEGGRHQLFKGVVSNGKLYLLKVQAGDKRWFKGVEKEVKGTFNSFTVA